MKAASKYVSKYIWLSEAHHMESGRDAQKVLSRGFGEQPLGWFSIDLPKKQQIPQSNLLV